MLSRSKVTGYAQDPVSSQVSWIYDMSLLSQHGDMKHLLSKLL